MMNMSEFVTEMIKSLPTPETLQQEMVQRAVESILNNLRNSGQTNYVWGSGEGSRAHCWQVCKRVAQVFNSRGYVTNFWEYSQNNRDKYCYLHVELP